MISVVIPLYNKEKYIKQTISNVLNQSYKDFELLVVDDGSTDNSLVEVNSFDDLRIRVIEKNNGGVSSARNVGIKEAKYDIIAFLDADDIWEVDYLETLHNMVVKYPNMVMYAQAYDKIWDNGKTVIIRNKFLGKKDVVVVENYNEYIAETPFICSSSVAINRNYISQSGLFDETLILGEDTDMWYRLALCGSLVYSTKITAHYVMSSSSTNNINLAGKLNRYYSYKVIKCYNDKDKLNQKILNRFILNGFILFLKYGSKEEALFLKDHVSFCILSLRDKVKYIYYTFKYLYFCNKC